jgi:GntR family transcriptional regulator
MLMGYMSPAAKSAPPRPSVNSKSMRSAGGTRVQGLTSPLATALHHQIFLVLRDRILSGVYASETLLPSEEKLSQMFRVSRVTVRAALTTLAANGFIERRQGVGTFVSGHFEPPPRMHVPMSDLLTHIAAVGRSTQVKLFELASVKAPLHVRSLFNKEVDHIFQRAVRLRSIHNLPIFYVVTYVPEDISRRFTRREMSGPSLYQLLRGEGFNFKAGEQTVSAALADPTVAAALNVEVGAPLLQIRRLHFDERMQPFEYMEMLASPARFELQMTLGADDFPI